jgi:hypothetical protein
MLIISWSSNLENMREVEKRCIKSCGISKEVTKPHMKNKRKARPYKIV